MGVRVSIEYIEARLYTNIAATNFSILQSAKNISFDIKYNEVGALNLSYPLEQAKALGLGDGSLVGLVVGHTDGSITEIERYIMETTSNDRVMDDQRYRTLTGRSSLSILDDAVVYPSNWPVTAPAGHQFIDSTPGTIWRTLILRARNRGTITPVVETSFTGVKDSSNVNWGFNFSIEYASGTTYLSILQDQMNRGLVDAKMDGWNLQLTNGTTSGRHVNIDTLEVRPAMNVTEMVTNTDATEQASTVLVEGDEGTAVERHDSVAVSYIGRRRERFLSQGGVSDAGFLSVLGGFELQARREIPTEETVGITDMKTLRVFKDFTAGDWVWVRQEGTEQPVERRIYQIACAVDDNGGLSIGLTLNSILAESLIKLQRKIEGYTNGGLGGSPTNGQVDDRIRPGKVEGVSAQGFAYPGNSGRTEVSVNVTWLKPPFNENGTAFDDLKGYIIRQRYKYTGNRRPIANNGQPTPLNTAWYDAEYPSDDENWQYSPLIPDVYWQVQVCAVDENNLRGEWSDIVEILLPKDNIPPNQPSKPIATSRLGTITVDWDGKDAGGVYIRDSDFDYVEVHGSTDQFANPVKGGPTLLNTWGQIGPNYFIHTGQPYGQQWYYWLIAVDYEGNASPRSQRSDPIATASLVDTDLITAEINGANIKPGTLNAADKIVGNTIIGGLIKALEIQTGHMRANAITAEKIDFGTLNGTLITGLQIQTSEASNYGVKIKNSGVEMYGPDGTLQFRFNTFDGSLYIGGNASFAGSLGTGVSINSPVITGGSVKGAIVSGVVISTDLYTDANNYQSNYTDRIQVRDDGNGGVIEFWTGNASFVRGVINAFVDNNTDDGNNRARIRWVGPYRPGDAASFFELASESGQSSAILSYAKMYAHTISLQATSVIKMAGGVVSANSMASGLQIYAGTSGTANQSGNFIDSKMSGSGSAFAYVGSEGRIVRGAQVGSLRALKENIETLTLEEAMLSLEMEPVSFHWKDRWNSGDDRHMGFIAEQVEESAAGDLYAEHERRGSNALLGVHYRNLHAAHHVLIKELFSRIEELEGAL